MAHPIVAWPGGKRRLLKHLLSDIPKHAAYVEAFAGGAALLFAKQPAKAEVLNDANGELIRLYRCVQHHLDELVRQFRWSLVSREMFTWLNVTRPDTLTDIQRAARFYYLQRQGFGARVTSRSFGVDPRQPPRLNLLRMEEDLSQAHIRLSRVTIEHLDWQELVQRYDRKDTLWFFDPPYWQTAGYDQPFGWDQYEALAVAMQGMKGQAILTLNNHPDLNPLFKPFRRHRVAVTHTAGGGKGKKTAEVIYRTW